VEKIKQGFAASGEQPEVSRFYAGEAAWRTWFFAFATRRCLRAAGW